MTRGRAAHRGEAAKADPLDDFDSFTRAVRGRLAIGEREYKGQSFTRTPGELLVELAQEALDLAGWGFVLWVRLRRMQRAIDGMHGGRRGVPSARRRVPRDDGAEE